MKQSVALIGLLVSAGLTLGASASHGARTAGRSRKINAYIRFEHFCGQAGGQEVFVVNSLRNKKVIATVQITTTTSGQSATKDDSVSVPAGGSVDYGCSIEGAMPPYIYHRYKVVGSEP